MRVKTPAFATPPLARMNARAFASAASSGPWPTSLSAKYASTVNERWLGAPS